jgi:hypothetical protein
MALAYMVKKVVITTYYGPPEVRNSHGFRMSQVTCDRLTDSRSS